MVELVLASGILLVTTVAGYGAQVRSAALVDSSAGRMIAMADLETCMEEMLIESASDIPNEYAGGQPVAFYTGLHLRNQQITPEYPGTVAGSPSPDPLEIVLTAQWTNKSGQVQSLRLMTAKAQ